MTDASGRAWVGILNSASYVRIMGNHVHDFIGTGIDDSLNYNHHSVEYIGNMVHGLGEVGSNQNHGIYLSTKGGKIINNIVYSISGDGAGIHLWHAATDVLIANNTIVNGPKFGMEIGAGDSPGGVTADNIRVMNNIVVNSQWGIYELGNTGSNNKYNNNLVHNTNTPGQAVVLQTGSAQGTLTSNPLFSNPSSGNFHLQPGSPAIDQGMTLPEVPCDFDGNRRPSGSAYDIGAFEEGFSPATDCPKGTTGTGATPTPLPATPTPVPPPAIYLSATPQTLSFPGQGTQLFWSVSNATSCTASGGWSGQKDPAGGTERYVPAQSTTYVLTCQGPGGEAQKSVTVTIGGSTTCTKYTSGSQIPQGFGVPWDVTNPSSLLLKADCTPPTIVLKVGDNQNLTYIYKNAYVAPSGSQTWTATDLYGGTLISGAWYQGFAQGIATIQDITQPSYYVAYTCKWIPTQGSGQAGQWKCGCRDSQCSQSYWQIQKMQQ